MAERQLRDSQASEQEARAAAEQQRAKFQRFIEQAPVAVAVYRGPRFEVETANATALAIWGRPLEAVRDRPVFEALPEAATPEVVAIFERVFATGTPHTAYEQPTVIRRHGRPEQVYWNVVFEPQHDPDGRINGIYTIGTDVTAQVRARQQVEQLNQELEARVQERTREAERQRRQWEQLFLRVPAAICIFDGPDWVYEFVNPGYQAMFPGRELLGKRLVDALPEVADQPLMDILHRVYDTGETFEGREVLVPLARYEGGPVEDIYFDLTYLARYDEQGRIDGFVTYAHDVTAQVQARERREAYAAEVQESEARFRTLADAAPNIVWDLNPDGSLRYVNKFCLEFLGISLAQFVGPDWMSYLLPEDVARTEQVLGQAIATRTLFAMEHRMRRHDGQYRWLLMQGGPSYYPNGELYGYVGSAIDITELKQANEQLRRTNVDLDNFIYTASHDLRAPISNIEGLLYLLQEALPPPVAQDAEVGPTLTRMFESVERFKRTIDHLTEVSKLQKEHAPEAAAVNLAAVVEDVRQDLLPLLQATGAKLVVDVPALPAIQFPEKNLRSIVYNLLSNAVKYHSPDRPPRVDVRAHVRPGHTVLEVHDNGLGIAAHQLPKLFGMFQRFHDHVPGTGIGLYMVKRMVENAGGRIEVHSQLGAGTTFFVFLPHTLAAGTVTFPAYLPS